MIQNGHPGLFVARSGFFIHPVYSFLGASPDGSVYDPSSQEPYGFLEIKCTFKYLPEEAATKSDFWCSVVGNTLKLKENHVYYSQVQGQMAVPWCDFCTYTKKGLYVEQITFEEDMWGNDLSTKTDIILHCTRNYITLGFKLRDLNMICLNCIRSSADMPDPMGTMAWYSSISPPPPTPNPDAAGLTANCLNHGSKF